MGRPPGDTLPPVPAPSVLACGHVTLDRLGDLLLPGGSVYYAATTLAALGARTRVLTAAGPDFPPDALAGIEVEVRPAPVTTTFVNTYGRDGRRTQHVLCAAPPLDPADLPPAWRGSDLLFLAPVLGEIGVRAFAEAARARFVGLGVQGLVRAVGPDGVVRPRLLDTDPASLAAVDAAVLGEDEAQGDATLVSRLAGVIPVVAFTHGAQGCEVIARGRTRRVGVHPACEVDPTGAGDVFAAGFFLALARGEDPVDAARLGAAAASIAVEGRGGEALPRVGEALARAARVPVLS
jgi:sugar/nucleoside kinase (ribokinase family)